VTLAGRYLSAHRGKNQREPRRPNSGATTPVNKKEFSREDFSGHTCVGNHPTSVQAL
jgi:hypothetical protein